MSIFRKASGSQTALTYNERDLQMSNRCQALARQLRPPPWSPRLVLVRHCRARASKRHIDASHHSRQHVRIQQVRCLSSSSSSSSTSSSSSSAGAGTGADEEAESVTIGGVTAALHHPTRPELVPRGFLPAANGGSRTGLAPLPQSSLAALRWMMQKDAVGQDLFLVGPPGAARRLLALQWCELLQREVELLTISRDTTESELKQRREIESAAGAVSATGTAAGGADAILGGATDTSSAGDGGTVSSFVDQGPVRAALHGRVLILDGLEKAERNVLPTLNNLLENREMALDDGRFIVGAAAWDGMIAAGHSDAELHERNLVRAHDGFRVIALGLAVPPYAGAPLDPPLRSRFQARWIDEPAAEELTAALIAAAPSLDASTASVGSGALRPLVQVSEMMHTLEAFGEQMAGTGRASTGKGSTTGGDDSASSSGAMAAAGRFPHMQAESLCSAAHTLQLLADGGAAADAVADAALLRDLVCRGFPWAMPPADAAGVSGISLPASAAEHQRVARAALARAGLPVASDQDGSTGQAVLAIHNARRVGSDTLELQFALPTTSSATDSSRLATISMRGGGLEPRLPATLDAESGVVSSPPQQPTEQAQARPFFALPAHSNLLASMALDVAAGRDILLVGNKGGGKSAVAGALAASLGYRIELVPLYRDMTARELLQRRATTSDGVTYWQDAPLVRAARAGRLAVLDGIDRLAPDTAATLMPLLQERWVELPDGTRLCRDPQPNSDTAGAADAIRVEPIHPGFRVIALGSQPGGGAGLDSPKGPNAGWFSEETVSMFATHVMPQLSVADETALLCATSTTAAEKDAARALAALSARMRGSTAAPAQDGTTDAAAAAMLRPPLPGTTLSLRQLLRVCRQYSSMLSGVGEGGSVAGSGTMGKNALAELVRRSLLADFFSPTQTSALDDAMESAGIFDVDDRLATDSTPSAKNAKDTLQTQRVEYVMADGSIIEASEAESGTVSGSMVGDAHALRIGDVEVPLSQPKRPELVPRPLFFAIAQHVETLRSLLSDVHGGERQLLLIGNQGVGKNKLADRLLQLLRMEREYVQLHRDTTVASLSSTPSLKGGAVVYSEAPLVRAARFGRAVVLDEADKAPLEVVTVLKGLLEDGEMPLADGRRLLAPHRIAAELEAASSTSLASGIEADEALPADVIPIHPKFSMWVLANRPGFPFHGNDFFRECGDTFSAHCIANPDHDSELELLRSYAPDVPNRVLAQLGGAFTELREMASAGLLAYPYSARESVAVARHLQLYPADGITDALEGVLAFDAADERVRSSVAAVFERHGIVVEAETLGRRGAERTLRGMRPTVALAQHMKVEAPVQSEQWQWAWDKTDSSCGKAKAGSPDVGVEALTEYGMIPFMNMYLPPDSSASAQRTPLIQSMERVRLNRFSEEDRRVWLPFTSRFQRACSLAFGADGDSVHALTTEPLGIYSYHGLASTAIGSKQGADGTSPYMTAVQLQGGWPTEQPSSLPSLCAIPRPSSEGGNNKASASDLLVVHLPSVRDGLMMLIDPEPNRNSVPWLESGREAAALQVPPEPAAVARVRSPLPLEFVPPSGGSAVTNDTGSVHDDESNPMRRLGALSRMIGGGQFSDGTSSDNSGAVKLIDTLRGEGTLLRYREGGTSLTMIRIAPGAVAECARLELHLGRDSSADAQAGIRSVQVLSRDTWKVDTTAGTQVLVNGALSAAFGASSGLNDVGDGVSAIRVAPIDVQQLEGARIVDVESQVPLVLSTPPAHALPTVALPPAHLGGSLSPVSSATATEADAAESNSDAAPEPAIIDWSARSLAHPQKRLGVLIGAPSDGVVVNGCPSPSTKTRTESGSITIFSSVRGDGITDVGALSPAEPIARTEAEAHDDMTWARAHRSLLVATDLPHTGQHLVATALRAEPGTSAKGSEAWAPGAPWTEVDGVELEITDPAELSVRSIRLSSATEPLAPHLREVESDEASASAQSPTEEDTEGAGGALCAGGDRSVSLLVGAGELSNGETVTLQANGAIRFWQVDAEGISEDLDGWRRLFRDEDIDGLGDRFVGDGSDDETRKWLQIARRGGKGDWSTPRTGTDMPKHGKAPDGKAHVGGNTWAGGSGGSDTAGLGGRGGPYRLDGGHPVHQITEAAKAEVSEEARERAKQMAKEGLEERLKEIDMTGGEWQAYEQYYSRISAQVAQLRVILEGVESRAQERVWLRHQSSGEIDDAKIVDGAAGERNIFRRRGSDASRRAGQTQPKPKRLIFAFDVSGSMYRFNGQDGRLERSLEAAMMLMESFVGFERRFQYALVGHSGDSASIPFVEFGKPPANRKERLAVLQRMLAHSQFCMSGDHTLEAAAEAVEAVADPALGDSDEMMAFVISDANLRRYGIPPEDLGQALMADSRVKAHAIFIASMADEAQRILRALPTGRGFVCLDSSDLPATLKEIFSAELWGGGGSEN